MTGMTRVQWTRALVQLVKVGHEDHAQVVARHLEKKGKLPALHLCTNPNLARCKKG